MKLSVEIKDGKFIYDYEIGLSTQHGNLGLSAPNLLCFTNMLEVCQKAAVADHNQFCAHITAKSYMEKFPEESQKYLDKLKRGIEK